MTHRTPHILLTHIYSTAQSVHSHTIAPPNRRTSAWGRSRLDYIRALRLYRHHQVNSVYAQATTTWTSQFTYSSQGLTHRDAQLCCTLRHALTRTHCRTQFDWPVTTQPEMPAHLGVGPWTSNLHAPGPRPPCLPDRASTDATRCPTACDRHVRNRPPTPS